MLKILTFLLMVTIVLLPRSFEQAALARADMLSVKDFGVAGDAREDDTDELQAAIDAAVAQRRTLYWPAGTYLIRSPLRVRGQARWIGEGPEATQIKNLNTHGQSAVEILGIRGTEVLWSTFSGIGILGHGTGAGRSDGHGWYTRFAGRIEWQECLVRSVGGNGFHYENSWSPTFMRSRAEYCKGDGVHIRGGPDHKANGAVVDGGAYSHNGRDGLYLDAASDGDTISGVLRNVGFSNNQRNNVTVLNNSLIMLGCFLENANSYQLQIGSSADHRVVRGGEVLGCYFLGDPGASTLVHLENSHGVRIAASNFKTATTAIAVEADCSGITIENCRKSGDIRHLASYKGIFFTDTSKPLRLINLPAGLVGDSSAR